MTRLTQFRRFHMAIEQAFGFPIEKLERELEQGDTSVKLDNVIQGEHGLYSLIERDGKLFVAKIILHIADFQVYILRLKAGSALEAYQNKDYDSPNLRRVLHKYHLYSCNTIQNMFDGNRGHRYRQSHRKDGKFYYYYVDRNNRYKKEKNQKLNVCRYCLDKFNHDTSAPPVGIHGFTPEHFFDAISSSKWLPDCGNLPDMAPPPTYSRDFEKIAEEVKKRREYRCEQCDIFLERPSLKKFLHCHHKDMDKTNNLTANLLCLCIKCHAEQPRHKHMRNLPTYKEFLPIWTRINEESSYSAQREHLGDCPKCGAPVLDAPRRFSCTNSLGEQPSCDFGINRQILSRPISAHEVRQLITQGKTDLLQNFISKKTRRKFRARLTVDLNDEPGKFGFASAAWQEDGDARKKKKKKIRAGHAA